jgi:hypothetical protein
VWTFILYFNICCILTVVLHSYKKQFFCSYILYLSWCLLFMIFWNIYTFGPPQAPTGLALFPRAACGLERSDRGEIRVGYPRILKDPGRAKGHEARLYPGKRAAFFNCCFVNYLSLLTKTFYNKNLIMFWFWLLFSVWK